MKLEQTLTSAEARCLLGVTPEIWAREFRIHLKPVPVEHKPAGRPTERFKLADVMQLFEAAYSRPPTSSEVRQALQQVQKVRDSSLAYQRSKRLGNWVRRRRNRKTAVAEFAVQQQWAPLQ
jgi:hypothetical protein